MPIFKLTPLADKRTDPAWTQWECYALVIVAAEKPSEARHIATECLPRKSVEKEKPLGTTAPKFIDSPWGNNGLTDCVLLDGEPPEIIAAQREPLHSGIKKPRR